MTYPLVILLIFIGLFGCGSLSTPKHSIGEAKSQQKNIYFSKNFKINKGIISPKEKKIKSIIIRKSKITI
jgi:hypothetical protein